jgi:hypothetical protein
MSLPVDSVESSGEDSTQVSHSPKPNIHSQHAANSVKVEGVEVIDAPPSPSLLGDQETHIATAILARAYQLEMLEESLKQNTIVTVRLPLMANLPLPNTF